MESNRICRLLSMSYNDTNPHSMKSSILLFLLLGGIFTANAQVDTIYTHEERIPCNIVEITETAAKFQYPGEAHNNSLSLNAVSKIIYRSGRVQEFAGHTSFRRLASPMDWQQVSIASVESEVQGLYKVDDVSSKAKGTTEFSNQERVKRRALDKIKMQAAILGANVLYMAQMRSEGTKVNFWTGAGTSAETSLFGVAYSSQMPRLSTVSELVKDNREFAVAEEISLTNNDTNFGRSSTAKTLTIDRIYDDSGLVMIEGTLSKSKETLFRVTFCNDHDFYIAYKTRRGVFSYKVTVQ